MSIVTFILSLFGVQNPSEKKSVSFAEGTKDQETPLTQDAPPAAVTTEEAA